MGILAQFCINLGRLNAVLKLRENNSKIFFSNRGTANVVGASPGPAGSKSMFWPDLAQIKPWI